jgi:hypothetical protein
MASLSDAGLLRLDFKILILSCPIRAQSRVSNPATNFRFPLIFGCAFTKGIRLDSPFAAVFMGLKNTGLDWQAAEAATLLVNCFDYIRLFRIENLPNGSASHKSKFLVIS